LLFRLKLYAAARVSAFYNYFDAFAARGPDAKMNADARQ
jgi:hypothetical protein